MKRKYSPEQQRRKEELLRPSRYLGYDHDNIGIYLFSRGAYEIAEAEFRRSVWLNPFEVKFKVHLACCLYERKQFKEALKWVNIIIKQNPRNKKAQELLRTLNSC